MARECRRRRNASGNGVAVMDSQFKTNVDGNSRSPNCYRAFVYVVDQQHSTVLGYSATSKTGARLWGELDWRGVRQDGGQHFFNPCGGQYLHVRCKYDPDQDGAKPCPVSHRRWYRVRCRHEIGSEWRGGSVKDVEAQKRGRTWVWIVHVDR